MKKMLLSFLMLNALGALSQSISSDFFEVHTKLAHPRSGSRFSFSRDSAISRMTSLPDTSAAYATFVVTVSDPEAVDSVILTLTNSLGQVAYSNSSSISTLQSSPTFRITGNTLYFEVGPYPYLKRFTATARIRSTNGQYTSIQSFNKN